MAFCAVPGSASAFTEVRGALGAATGAILLLLPASSSSLLPPCLLQEATDAKGCQPESLPDGRYHMLQANKVMQ